MSLKRKLRAKKPPLSLLDRLIYYVLIFIGTLSGVLIIFIFGDVIPTKVAFLDSSVVASRNIYVLFPSVFLAFSVSMPIVIISSEGLRLKQPIFGNKKFKPKVLEPTLKVYPIFTKDFRENLTKENKIKIKKTAKLLMIFIIVSILIFSLCIFQRNVITDENNFISYNMFNSVKDTYNIDEAEKLIIDITRGKNPQYVIDITFVFENHKHSYVLGSFYEMDTEDALEYMIYLKGFMKDGRYEVRNADKMYYLLFGNSYTATETSLIYELFDYNR